MSKDIVHTIAEISDNQCYGCRACCQICPQKCIIMQPDNEGFLFPIIKFNDCIQCGLCYRVCPVNHSIAYSPRKVFAVKSKNKKTQYLSSSGGAFMELSSWAIENGHIVYGAVYEKNTFRVYHKSADNFTDILRFRGSKYVQSDTCNTFTEVKENLCSGKKVLFSGLPCQIQGLKNYLQKDYLNLVCIDILCHGVPSPLLFRDYITCISRKYGIIKSINMKDKTNGWGKQNLKFEFENSNKQMAPQIAALWNTIFYSNIALRESCYSCKFACFERCGDISLGDYWGIEKYQPQFFDRNGVSLMLVNTLKGDEFVSSVAEKFQLEETKAGECFQPALKMHTSKPPWREYFWRYYQYYGFEDAAYTFWKVALSNPLLLKIKRLLKRR